MTTQLIPPDIHLSDEELTEGGFTNSGATRFKETIKGYSDILFQRSIHLGDVDKAPNLPREITHDHVRAAAFSIAKSYGKPPKSKWLVPAQIGEYVAVAVTGAGASNLDESMGMAAFGLGLAIAVILIVARLLKTKSEW